MSLNVLQFLSLFLGKKWNDSQRRAEPWGRGCICTPCFTCPTSNYAPPEIWKSMFLPLLKKAVMGGGEGQHTSGDLPIFNIFRPPKIHCYNPYSILGKQLRAEPWVICPCWFKTGGHRGQTPTHPPALNLYPILFKSTNQALNMMLY